MIFYLNYMETEINNKSIKLIKKDDIDIKDVLNNILSISVKMYEEQQNLYSKITNLEIRMTNIEKNIVLRTKYNGDCIEDLVEIKKESLDIPQEEFFKAIKYRDYRSVLHVLKYYYKNKNNLNYSYPIKIISQRSYEYYYNYKWHPDAYGHYIMNIIIKNIEEWFMKNNLLDNKQISPEEFMLNQEFICKLSNEKYKRSIFKNIIEEVRINNI